MLERLRPLPHRTGCTKNSPLDTIWKVAGWLGKGDKATSTLASMRIPCEAAMQLARADRLSNSATGAPTGILMAILSKAEELNPHLRKSVEECVIRQTERISKNIPDGKDDKDDIAGNGALFLEKMTSVMKNFRNHKDFAKSWMNLLKIASFLPESQKTKSLTLLIDLIPYLPAGEIRANGFHDAAHKIITAASEDQPLLTGKLIENIAKLSTENQKIKATHQVLLLLQGVSGADIGKQLNDLLGPVWSLDHSAQAMKFFTDICYLARTLSGVGRLTILKTLADNLPKLAGTYALGSGTNCLMKEIKPADPVTYRAVLARIEKSFSEIAEQIYHDLETNGPLQSQKRDFDELSAALGFLPANLQHRVISSLTGTTRAVANQKSLTPAI